jgi:protein-S-isoprenylcysteine O-methyltransferase Ste14
VIKIAPVLVAACWIIFAIYWLISAWGTKKTTERQSWKDRIAHRIPIVFGVLLLRPTPRPHIHSSIIVHNPAVQAAAVILCVLGLLGAIWSRRTIARNWSGDVVFKEEHELVERGPYRWVRHPIYTSILLMALGSALLVCRWTSFAGFLVMAVGFLIKLRQEEALLLRHFPSEYSAYKSRVKTLIPFVW